MPVLPHLFERAVTAADSRILDSRQWLHLARRATHTLSLEARHLLTRAPQLVRRDSSEPLCKNGVIAWCYAGLFAGPTPAAIVGIILGSVVGFLLLMWLLFVLSSGGGFIRTTALEEEDVVVTRRHRSRSPGSRRTHRSSYNAEMRRTSPRRDRDRVIRQERIVRDVPPPRRESSRTRVRESIIVEEDSRPDRRVEGDDIVEVIEEHSSVDGGAPPPRRKSRRGSRYT